MNKLSQWNQKVDALTERMKNCPAGEFPVKHRFTPGLYIREIFMPKGSLIVSKIHKTEHPFVVSQGSARIISDDSGHIETVSAPHCGITKPGTRRVLFIVEDCVWTTFHPTAETDLAKIEQDIIEPHDLTPITEVDRARLEGV
jgi:hypothetical protein